MDLKTHAGTSADIRSAANMADEIGKNLLTINGGPIFEKEAERLVEQVDIWFRSLAGHLGYRIEKDTVQ